MEEFLKVRHADENGVRAQVKPLVKNQGCESLPRLIFDGGGMSFSRWGFQVEGTYLSDDQLNAEAGVYVIWCNQDNNWTVLDVGESDNVQARVRNHDRADCWKRHCSGTLYYSAVYMTNSSAAARRNVERTIRDLERNVPCGK